MALDTKQYLEELYKAAGVSDDNVKQAVSNFFTNDAVAKRVGDDILRQQDYSRNMDELRKKEQATTNYYQDLVKWKAGEEARLAALYVDPANGSQPVNGEYLTKKELAEFQKQQQEELNKRDQNYIGLLKVGMRLASQHVNEFHESLDTEALTKIAVDKGISIEQAYNEMVGPRRTEFQTAQRTAEIAKAREEGARDFASKHKIPVDTAAREYHVMLDRDPSGKAAGITDYEQNSGRLNTQQSRTLRENFVSEWDKAGTQTSGT